MAGVDFLAIRKHFITKQKDACASLTAISAFIVEMDPAEFEDIGGFRVVLKPDQVLQIPAGMLLVEVPLSKSNFVSFWPSLVTDYVTEELSESVEACWQAASADVKKKECKSPGDQDQPTTYGEKVVVHAQMALDFLKWATGRLPSTSPGLRRQCLQALTVGGEFQLQEPMKAYEDALRMFHDDPNFQMVLREAKKLLAAHIGKSQRALEDKTLELKPLVEKIGGIGELQASLKFLLGPALMEDDEVVLVEVFSALDILDSFVADAASAKLDETEEKVVAVDGENTDGETGDGENGLLALCDQGQLEAQEPNSGLIGEVSAEPVTVEKEVDNENEGASVEQSAGADAPPAPPSPATTCQSTPSKVFRAVQADVCNKIEAAEAEKTAAKAKAKAVAECAVKALRQSSRAKREPKEPKEPKQQKQPRAKSQVAKAKAEKKAAEEENQPLPKRRVRGKTAAQPEQVASAEVTKILIEDDDDDDEKGEAAARASDIS